MVSLSNHHPVLRQAQDERYIAELAVNAETLEGLLLDTRAQGIERVVAGAVIRNNGAVLLLKRAQSDYLGGIYELPSGAVEDGETLYRALRREVAEETGLEVVGIGPYLGCFDYPSGSGILTRQLNFLVTVRPAAVALSPEHETFAWVDKAGLAEYPVSQPVQALISGVL